MVDNRKCVTWVEKGAKEGRLSTKIEDKGW